MHANRREDSNQLTTFWTIITPRFLHHQSHPHQLWTPCRRSVDASQTTQNTEHQNRHNHRTANNPKTLILHIPTIPTPHPPTILPFSSTRSSSCDHRSQCQIHSHDPRILFVPASHTRPAVTPHPPNHPRHPHHPPPKPPPTTHTLAYTLSTSPDPILMSIRAQPFL